MSTIKEIHEPNLELLITNYCREPGITLPKPIHKLIIQYIDSISRILRKNNIGERFQIQILTPEISKLNQKLYNMVQYKFTNLNFQKKFCMGVASSTGTRTRRNKIKKLQNRRTFWGIFVCDNKIFIKEQGVIHSLIHKKIQVSDVIVVENNLNNGHWRISLQRRNLTDIILFNFAWISLNQYQFAICFFDDQDKVCMSEIHAYKTKNNSNNKIQNNNHNKLFKVCLL